MRADASRNVEAVLRAAARVFSADPLARITDVAVAAGLPGGWALRCQHSWRQSG